MGKTKESFHYMVNQLSRNVFGEEPDVCFNELKVAIVIGETMKSSFPVFNEIFKKYELELSKKN